MVTPKDKYPKLNKIVIIYYFECPHIKCPEAYIGESGMPLGDRIKEHLKAPLPFTTIAVFTGHQLSPECFNIIHQETQGPSRNIKEAMFIRVNDPSLNRNLGKYQLPHIWDNFLQDKPMLQVKQSNFHPPYPPTGTTPSPGSPTPLTPQHLIKGRGHMYT